MKILFTFLTAAVVHGLLAFHAHAAAGFTDSDVLFFGEVRQVGGAQTVLLQAGHLELTFVNQSNPANRVTLETELEPTGVGDIKPYSYALKVPLAYLPEAPRIGEFLSIGSEPTDFRIEEITINGTPATLPDGSKEFYGLSFASRASDYQLDLLVVGDSTDSDGDGLPDWWESLHGLDPDLADASSDPDSDGWNNLEEFRRGSDPSVSNREPQLATAVLYLPESGETGVYLHILDSDTAAADIDLGLTGCAEAGFELRVDGAALSPGEIRHLPLSDLQAGRITLHHNDRSSSQLSLPVSWSDGGGAVAGEVLVRVTTPSTADGNDSTLWLDGGDLTNDGGGINTWGDRSGNGRTASQPLPAHQPVISDHAADFSKSQTAHLFFQDLVLPTGDHTVLAAYRAAPSADAAQTLFSTNRGFMKIAPTSQAVSYPGAPTYQMDGIAVRGYEDSSGLVSTSTFRREGSLLENVFGLSFDGETVAPVAIDPVLPTIGARRSAISSGGDPVDDAFGGRLHELLVFPIALPEQKLRDVHDYLQSKWGGSVIWDLSNELKAVSLLADAGTQCQIIRGGHGDDQLGGGPLADLLSGGPGADTLTGGGGIDRFVFGAVDTGADRITDFDPQTDVIDLSALFWGQTGDARQFISVRLDANFSTEIPTLDSVLIVTHPGGGSQEIVLENTVIGAPELIQLIVEGHIRMGSLNIPTVVQIARVSGDSGGLVAESLDQPFHVVLTRSGEGVGAALDVPLGFFENALDGSFVIDGATSNESRRSVVRFERGETSKTLTIRPVPDLETAGATSVQVAVLSQYKYSVSGAAVDQSVTDAPLVWLELVQANAVSDIGQPARLRIHRDGSLAQGLSVDVRLGGTAREGVHIQPVPDSLTIPAGQESSEILIHPVSEGLSAGAKAVHFQLVSSDVYQLGNPNEAVMYAAASSVEANNAGLDRWLQASTGGAISGLGDLAGLSREEVARYLQAYAFGLASVDELASHRITFQIVNGRPEILTHSPFNAADVRWGVASSLDMKQWSDASGAFSEAQDASGLKLVGEPLVAESERGFYRLGVNLEPGELVGSGISSLAGTTAFGLTGNSTWNVDQSNGDLTSSGGSTGDASRIVANSTGDLTLDFEMRIIGGGPDDSIAFYIDGVLQAMTRGDVVTVQRELAAPGTRLLMWEFKRGGGNAVIRNLAK